ncbi:MAG: N-acetylglucosamine-6-phosphate deacetylase [Gemmatimonadaceae bacterium]
MSTILEGPVVFPHCIRRAQVSVSGDRITGLATDEREFAAPDRRLTDELLIAPGFIDIQINGGFGKEFNTDLDALAMVAREVVRFGTTAFCPTITTAPLERYASHARGMLAGGLDAACARFLGFHFEGPALSAKRVGAHNPTLLKLPSDLITDEYLGSVPLRIVTFAPELARARELIEELRRRGIRVGVGHSVASHDELAAVFDAEMMIVVHLLNAMEPITAREPGIAGFALANPECVISVIPDGIHTHPATLKAIWNAKTDKTKIVVISDGTAVTGLPLGAYAIGDRTIYREPDRSTLPGGTLVGSVMTLDQAVRNLIRFTGCTVSEAISTVTINPATFLGLEDDVGRVAVGCKADLVVLDRELRVRETYVGGNRCYESDGQPSS